MLKDDAKTLAEAGMRAGAKVMLVGSSRDEREKVESITVPKPLYQLRNPQGRVPLSIRLTGVPANLPIDREYKEPETEQPKKKRFHYINTLPMPRSDVCSSLHCCFGVDVYLYLQFVGSAAVVRAHSLRCGYTRSDGAVQLERSLPQRTFSQPRRYVHQSYKGISGNAQALTRHFVTMIR